MKQAGINESEVKAPGGPPVAHLVAEGGDWRVAEYVCGAGPGDRPFEERYDTFTIAAVVEGSFTCRSETGTALLHPGSLLLGNHGTCFECGHDHSVGDRCIAFHLAPDYFAEVAASSGGTGTFRFPTGMVPALPGLAPWLVRLEARAITSKLEVDEAIAHVMEDVIGATSDAQPSIFRISPLDIRRVSAVIRHIELHSGEDLELDQLASMAAMSKYHFLRTFRRTVGTTPYQFVLGIRLRRTAVRLLTSNALISSIAFDAGFGDLSTFNARFRKNFGASPSVFRQRNRSR